MEEIQKLKNKIVLIIQKWSRENTTGILVFNVILAGLILLHSAGYFNPFFPLTINIIFLFSLILSAILLGFDSKVFFIFAFFFWILAGMFRTLEINIWAERTAIYVFESLVVGMILLVIENVRKNKNIKRSV